MPIAVNGLTNQLSNANYDLNGNMTSGVGATLTYDSSNRMLSAAEVSGGTEYYGYSPDNKRMYRLTASGTEEWTFYGGYGEKLGVFQYSTSAGLYPVRSNVYFAGRTILDDNFPVFQDRVGTNRANGARFMPFGDEITSTSNDREKFATYTRDSYTGLDYADQRFYASTYGRFNTPDPSGGSVNPGNPQSWNRYSYTLGDPINGTDPSGLDSNFCMSSAGLVACGGAGGDPRGQFLPGPTPFPPSAPVRPIHSLPVQGNPDRGAGGVSGFWFGSTAQNGIVQGNPSFAVASAALAGEQADLATLFLGSQSPECEGDLSAVGVTDAQVAQAAGNANVMNGLTSLTNYAQDIYGNSPAANAASNAYGTESMAQYMSLNPNVAAVSQAPGSNIYINAAWVNGMTTSQQTAMLLHELLHGITGLTDDAIQGALGLPTNTASQNIGNKLQADCLK